MTRVTLIRLWQALCAGRAPDQVARRLVAAFAMAATLWASACAFLLMGGAHA